MSKLDPTERDDWESLEAVVRLVRDAGLATGHADDYVMLMREVLEQVEAIRLERDTTATELGKANEALAEAIQKNQKLRARLDHYEKGRCCVEEPPEIDGMYLARNKHGAAFLIRRRCGDWTLDGTSAYLIGWRWYPLPGGRDDDDKRSV